MASRARQRGEFATDCAESDWVAFEAADSDPITASSRFLQAACSPSAATRPLIATLFAAASAFALSIKTERVRAAASAVQTGLSSEPTVTSRTRSRHPPRYRVLKQDTQCTPGRLAESAPRQIARLPGRGWGGLPISTKPASRS